MSPLVAKAATNEQSFRRPMLFYRSAREAFEDLLRHRLAEGAEGVLLPAFIGWSPREGSGVFDPVRSVGTRYGFYDLNGDLTVNLAVLEAILARREHHTLVLIHYFGRTEPQLEGVRVLADRYNVLLVEDLAHGFYSAFVGGAAGHVGDVSLYSLHKMFPFPEGGMIGYRNVRLIGDQKETAPELAKAAFDYDWRAIALYRRAIFTEVVERLVALPESGTAFSMLWPQLARDDSPQSLPVQLLTGDRDHVYHRMNAEGYGMTSLYHTMIPELGDNHPEMTALSRSIINFPVHQDVAAESIDGMIKSFRQALGAR